MIYLFCNVWQPETTQTTRTQVLKLMGEGYVCIVVLTYRRARQALNWFFGNRRYNPGGRSHDSGIRGEAMPMREKFRIPMAIGDEKCYREGSGYLAFINFKSYLDSIYQHQAT
jgi:hypothetical protein